MNNNVMTIKEVSEAFNVSERTIRRHALNMGLTVNGIKTLLNESQVTEIKLKLERSSQINLDTSVQLPVTKLEEDLKVFEVFNILKNRVDSQQAQIEVMKPKALFYDEVAGSKSALSMSEAAKIIDSKMGRNKLFLFLRDQGILRYNNEPYQKYIDNGWFRVVEQKYNVPSGDINISIKTLVFQKGIECIIKLLGKNHA